MSNHVTFNVLKGPTVERMGFLASRVIKFTLNDTGNRIWLRGKKKPLHVTDSGQDIARGMGVWRPRVMMTFTQVRKGEELPVDYPAELLANSTYYAEAGNSTRILTPDGQSVLVKEPRSEVIARLAEYNVYFQEEKTEVPSEQLIF